MNENQQWMTVIEDAIQCFVCLEIPRCTVFQCATGHHICTFCKDRLDSCPMCQAKFIPTRNYLAEEMSRKFEDIKLCVLEEIEIAKRKGSGTVAVDASTQTECKISTTCSSVQTDKPNEKIIQRNENKELKDCTGIVDTKQDNTMHPCLIGYCIVEKPYRLLIEHLKENHNTIFYRVNGNNGRFAENWMIDTDVLPWKQDMAFHAISMGLFFFNIQVHNSGQIMVTVSIAKPKFVQKWFNYNLVIKSGIHSFAHQGNVIACQANRVHMGNMSKQLHMTTDALSNYKMLKCTLTVTTRKYIRH